MNTCKDKRIAWSRRNTFKHRNNDGNNRNTQIQNTHSEIIRKLILKKKKKKIQKHRNGFLTFSTLNPKAKIFTGIPYKNGFLYTFTNDPSLSQCLQQKTSTFHSTLLSPPDVLWRFFSQKRIFLVLKIATAYQFSHNMQHRKSQPSLEL